MVEEMTEWANRPLYPGRCLTIVANPAGGSTEMARGGANRMPLSVKRRYFELIRQGLSGAEAASEVGCR